MDKTILHRLANSAWALGVLALVGSGCVQSRPSRNGVFNENQYVRKDFLIRGGDSTTVDPGWLLNATVTKVSTPNPIGGDAGISPGISSGGSLVRFKVTEDKLQMLNVREITNVDTPYRSPEVLNAWSVNNVDLKYRINLDGEITNFLEENQELDWQVRQWVKLKFAKNDMSDVAPFGSYANEVLNLCTDVANSSATLVPGSLLTDDKAGYMEWSVEISLPIKFDNAACVTSYGDLGREFLQLGRQNVTFTLKYSLVRARPLPKDPAAPNAATEVTYKTLEIGEKDPIRHKYGFLETMTLARNPDTGLLAARELVGRFDPQKPIIWYFAPGFPDAYKAFFNDPASGMAVATSKLLKDAGATANVEFREWNDTRPDPKWCPDAAHCQESLDDKGAPLPRNYGDVRYSFLVWLTDQDTQGGGWAGVTVPIWDPRTGEAVSTSITFNDFAIKDYYVQRVDAYLQSVGASADVNSTMPWPDPGMCKDGDVLPVIPATVANNHNGNSSLYAKMQQYLQKPQSTYGNLGPKDFIWKQDDDFFRAYFAILPFQVFADPDVNAFVIREGGSGVLGPGAMLKKLSDEADFQTVAASIDRGEAPYELTTGPEAIKSATAFLNKFKKLTLAHQDYVYAKNFAHPALHMDTPDAFSFEQIMQRDARHCINGTWETKEQWVKNLINTYWQQVAWHEFGHSMSLEHNFMASVDKNNFPHFQDKAGNDHIGLFASSVMEYNAAPDRIFAQGGWAPYDMGAISFAYGNNGTNKGVSGNSISGQSGVPSSVPDADKPNWKAPWSDPHGFSADGKTETQFLFCSHQHLKYTPFCRQGDSGVTPSEIIANQIDAYEWQYHWRNFRTYRKFWDNSAYANAPAGLILDMRRFIEAWEYDWSGNELTDTLRRIGIKNPDPNGSDVNYYSNLTNKFNADASAANTMVAAFHKAIIQQSSGERPFRTIYDKYYGDTTQQGIILDKLFAMQGFVGLWPTDSYDPNQAGSYFASYSGIGDSSFNYVAEDAVTSMIGGQYDVYPYFVPLAVAQFAQDTHSPAFGGRIEVRDWIGGHVFYRLQDFLDYFRDIAVQNNYPGCSDIKTCSYDPRAPGVSDTHNEFFGPDKRAWIWAYVPDRNQWVAVQKERNTASYIIVRNYTDYVVYQQDDGAFPGGAYGALLPMKFFLDSFNLYN